MENEQPKEPTIIFLFDIKQWYQNISQISKIDLLDIAPLVSTQIFFDFSIQSYVMILTKSKWDILQADLKKKFMVISRRIKEEMEGFLSTIKREEYENSDLFELFMKNQTTEKPIIKIKDPDNNLSSLDEDEDDEEYEENSEENDDEDDEY
jgi:hypothetical protein